MIVGRETYQRAKAVHLRKQDDSQGFICGANKELETEAAAGAPDSLIISRQRPLLLLLKSSKDMAMQSKEYLHIKNVRKV